MNVDVVGIELPVGIGRRVGAGQAGRIAVLVIGEVLDAQARRLLLVELVRRGLAVGEGRRADGIGDELGVGDNVAYNPSDSSFSSLL